MKYRIKGAEFITYGGKKYTQYLLMPDIFDYEYKKVQKILADRFAEITKDERDPTVKCSRLIIEEL